MRWPWQTKADTAIETKSLANPSPELFALFGVPAGSISAERALTVPAVSAAIKLIAESAATLTIYVKKREGDAEVDVPDHPALSILRGQANAWTSGFELIRDLTAQALMHDNGGLAYVVKVRRQPREVIHYRPSIMQVVYDQSTGEPSYLVDNQPVNAADIIHVRGPFSRSPLSLAMDSIAAAKNMEGYLQGLWSNGARPGGFLTSDKPLGSGAIDNLKALWQQAFGGADNAGKTPVLPSGVTFEQMAMTSTDGEFTVNRTFQLNEIARAFRVPPGMIYEMSRQTWSNMEQASREFISTSLEPWLQALESAFNRALLTDAERKTHRIVFDRDDTSRADLTARATAISSLVSSRVINPNEGRDWLGMPPYAAGNQFANPNTGASQPGSPAGADKPANDNSKPQEAQNAA